jgi:hypothetical protein
MVEVNVKVSVICEGFSWTSTEGNRYRLYVNADILTERAWVYDAKTTYIEEDIWVNVKPGSINTVKIVPLLAENSKATFFLRYLKINDVRVENVKGTNHELLFQVR